jgi:hypothetical protein
MVEKYRFTRIRIACQHYFLSAGVHFLLVIRGLMAA